MFPRNWEQKRRQTCDLRSYIHSHHLIGQKKSLLHFSSLKTLIEQYWTKYLLLIWIRVQTFLVELICYKVAHNIRVNLVVRCQFSNRYQPCHLSELDFLNYFATLDASNLRDTNASAGGTDCMYRHLGFARASNRKGVISKHKLVSQ